MVSSYRLQITLQNTKTQRVSIHHLHTYVHVDINIINGRGNGLST